MSKDSKDFLLRAHSQGLADGSINFSVGLINSLVDRIGFETTVLEYGSTSSKFLRLLFLDTPYKIATGIILPEDSEGDNARWESPSHWPGRFYSESEIKCISLSVDIAFSNEIFGIVPDLREHATLMWEQLKPDGCYYSSFGWHSDNPYLQRHSQLRQSRGLPFFSRELDEVAQIFHEAGFEVGVKRLRIPYFMMFDPMVTQKRFGSVGTMISCLEDHRIIFSFRKLSNI